MAQNEREEAPKQRLCLVCGEPLPVTEDGRTNRRKYHDPCQQLGKVLPWLDKELQVAAINLSPDAMAYLLNQINEIGQRALSAHTYNLNAAVRRTPSW